MRGWSVSVSVYYDDEESNDYRVGVLYVGGDDMYCL